MDVELRGFASRDGMPMRRVENVCKLCKGGPRRSRGELRWGAVEIQRPFFLVESGGLAEPFRKS